MFVLFMILMAVGAVAMFVGLVFIGLGAKQFGVLLLIGGLVLLVGFGLLGRFIGLISSGSDYDPSESNVWSLAIRGVLDKLKAPSTAEFCDREDATIRKSGSVWTVEGYVDAQNDFGATIRNKFTVIVVENSEDNFSVSSVSIY